MSTPGTRSSERKRTPNKKYNEEYITTTSIVTRQKQKIAASHSSARCVRTPNKKRRPVLQKEKDYDTTTTTESSDSSKDEIMPPVKEDHDANKMTLPHPEEKEELPESFLYTHRRLSEQDLQYPITSIRHIPSYYYHYNHDYKSVYVTANEFEALQGFSFFYFNQIS